MLATSKVPNCGTYMGSIISSLQFSIMVTRILCRLLKRIEHKFSVSRTLVPLFSH